MKAVSLCLVWLCVLVLSGCVNVTSNGDDPLLTQTPAIVELAHGDAVANLHTDEVTEVQIEEIQAFPLEFDVQDVLVDGTSIWILGSQQITRLNRETLLVEDKYQNGDWVAIAFIKADNILWILNRPVSRNGYITEINVNTGKTTRLFEVGRYPMAMEYDGENLWVANFSDNTVTKIRVSDGVPAGTFPVGRGPIAIASFGSNLWVANSNDNTVMLLTATGKKVNTYYVGEFPSTLIAVNNAARLAHARDNRIMKLDPEQPDLIAQFAPSSCNDERGECGFSSLVFDGSGIWAAISLADKLIRFDPRNGLITDRISFPEGSRPGFLRYARGEDSDYLFVAHGSSRFNPPPSISRIEIDAQNE